MPPKARFTRDKIEDAAYALAKEKGIDAVAAREVAKSMGMTVTPIFTYFSGMEELKSSVLERARKEFVEYLRGSLNYSPAFKEFGLRWMRYARENPNLFRMLMRSGDGPSSLLDILDYFSEILEPITKEIARTFHVSHTDASALVRHMVVYTNGLTGFLLQGDDTFTEEQLSVALSQVCISLAVRAKIVDGTITLSAAKDILSNTDIAPQRKIESEISGA